MSDKNKSKDIEKDSEDSNILSSEYSIIELNPGLTESTDEDEGEEKNSDTLTKSAKIVRSVYKEFGNEFNINTAFDIESVLTTFESITSTRDEAIFNVFLSKISSKVRLAVYSKMLLALPVLADRLTEKDILESGNVELTVKVFEKILSLMDNINTMYSQIKLKDDNTLLKRIAEDKDTSGGEGSDGNLSKTEAIKLLNMLRSSAKNKN